MKKLSEITDQIADSEDLSSPELVKVDVQVRTGGVILPSSWFNRRDRTGQPKRSTNTLAEKK